MCAPDIFQENMLNLIEGLEFGHTYLINLPCLSKGRFIKHLEYVDFNNKD